MIRDLNDSHSHSRLVGHSHERVRPVVPNQHVAFYFDVHIVNSRTISNIISAVQIPVKRVTSKSNKKERRKKEKEKQKGLKWKG